MKNQFITLTAMVFLSISTPAFAANHHSEHNHSSLNKTQETSPSETNQMIDGEVKKIDLQNNKITIKHGEIKNLQMPPMTMVFASKNATQLEGLKKGDFVRFVVDQSMNITHIEKTPQ